MKNIETERTVFILKQDHTLMDSALRMQDMLKDGWQHDFSVQLQYQTLVYLHRTSTKSPKPDWVKEEIADAGKETIFRHLDLLESQLIATTSDDDRINEALEGMITLVCALRIGIRSMLAANRPSDDLLWAAYSHNHDSKDLQRLRVHYESWLKSLPPDTLKEDRELVKVMVLNDGGSFVKRYSENVVVALKRLCGMEVGNG